MISIKFYRNAIIAQGHANASIKGQDIYCAGVSAILMGAINWFDQGDIKYQFSDGDYLLHLVNESELNLLKLELLKIQLMALNKKAYQKYLELIDEGDKEWKRI